jgi:DNA replication and repair protein RecF
VLAQLSANHFRNLEPRVWQPAAGSHLLLGGNGAGKTSLLEAVYVLATTRSFRTHQLADCIAHGQELLHLTGEVEGDRRTRLEVGWGRDWRLRRVNDKPAALAEHLAALPVVAWTAADGEILAGPPNLRRRFLDRGVIGLKPVALEALGRYRQALHQKRELLAGNGEGLDAWNGVLAGAASELIELRKAYVDALSVQFQEVLAESGLAFPAVELHYRPSPASGLDGPEAIFHSLERSADRERQRQMPLLGPHRDDLEVRWGEHQLHRVASAGERKSLALLLLAAHGRVLKAGGADPLYLLDDVDTELAPLTLAAVWRMFAGARQLVASSNRPQVWLTLPVDALWEMERGVLRQL